MIAWRQFRPAFASLLERLSGVPAHVANSGDDGPDYTFPAGAPFPEPGSTDEGQVSLHFAVMMIATHGADETRQVYDADLEIDGDAYVPDPENPEERLGGIVTSVNGNRDVTIEITCDRFDTSAPAFETLARIRDKLWLPSARQACADLGIAVRGSSPITRVDAEIDGRGVSRYTLELRCNAMANAEDEAITTIETVPIDTSEVSA